MGGQSRRFKRLQATVDQASEPRGFQNETLKGSRWDIVGHSAGAPLSGSTPSRATTWTTIARDQIRWRSKEMAGLLHVPDSHPAAVVIAITRSTCSNRCEPYCSASLLNARKACRWRSLRLRRSSHTQKPVSVR